MQYLTFLFGVYLGVALALLIASPIRERRQLARLFADNGAEWIRRWGHTPLETHLYFALGWPARALKAIVRY